MANTKLNYILINGIKSYSPEVAERYDDYPDDGFDVTDKLEAESFWVRSRNRLLKEILLKNSLRPEETRFLDIGCGTGAVIQEVSEETSLKITGSEIYLKGLLYAKKKLPHVEFIQFDVTQGILPEKFDLIGAFDVIEHIEDDVTALSHIYEMLNDGGCFVITVPQYQFLWSPLDDIVKHKRRYSRQDLLSKIKSQGFVIHYCSSFLFILFPLMLVSRMLDSGKKNQENDHNGFEKRVSFPRSLNWIFDKFMQIDEFLIHKGLSLPYGGSLLCVCKKQKTNRSI